MCIYERITCTAVLPLFQQKHPHLIFEARTKSNKGCAVSGNLEWRLQRRTKHTSSGIISDEHLDMMHGNGGGRYRRDVREAIKYIETALIVDKSMFEKRNGSTRAEVVHDAIQVANIADLVSVRFFIIMSVLLNSTLTEVHFHMVDNSSELCWSW